MYRGEHPAFRAAVYRGLCENWEEMEQVSRRSRTEVERVPGDGLADAIR